MFSLFRKFDVAILKQPGKEIVNGLSLNKATNPLPDYQEALKQHTVYAHTLFELGVRPVVLGPSSDLPDGCFVEDTYLVTDDFVIRLNSAAKSRAGEARAIQDTIEELTLPRKFYALPTHLTMDGGDILVADKRIYIGVTTRTSQAAVDSVKRMIEKDGYDVQAVIVPAGLHLKSGVTCLTPDVFMVLPAFKPIMKALHDSLNEEKTYYAVTPGEEKAANILPMNNAVIMPLDCPNARGFILEYFKNLGIDVEIHEVCTREFENVDGLLTCLSIPIRTINQP